MEFSEQVLVLRVGTFREADCWVRFFSPTHGLLTGFAFGGRRSRKRFCGCLDHLSLVHFRVSQGRQDYFCLQEGVAVSEAYIADIQRYEETVLSGRNNR